MWTMRPGHEGAPSWPMRTGGGLQAAPFDHMPTASHHD
jgi:hypothetical protein